LNGHPSVKKLSKKSNSTSHLPKEYKKLLLYLDITDIAVNVVLIREENKN
jgi:hypothetical protein